MLNFLIFSDLRAFIDSCSAELSMKTVLCNIFVRKSVLFSLDYMSLYGEGPTSTLELNTLSETMGKE